MANPTCFENLIGITKAPCECLIEHLPADYDKSTSGLYVDELPQCPINLATMQSISSECDKDLATRLTNARQSAYDDFMRDLYQQLQLRFKPKYKAYTGFIGSTSGTSYLNISGAFAALVVKAKRIKGGEIKITGIYNNFSQAGTLTISIYRKIENRPIEDLVPIKTFDIAVQTNSTIADVKSHNIVLPCWDDAGSIKYYFVYSTNNGTMLPRNFINSCGCGDKESVLKSYMTSAGVNANSVNGLGTTGETSYINGLNLEVTINCGNDKIICEAREQNEFIKVTMDSCLQRKAVINLIQQLLHSTVINRYTQANREQMYYDAGSLQKKYLNDVQWISENMSMSLNDCYICQTENQPTYIAGILL